MDELEALQAQIAEMQRKAETLTVQKKAAVLSEIKSKIKAYGITLRELGLDTKPGSKSGTTVAVKYVFKDHTWTGRGRQPKWLVAYIQNGGTLEELEV